MRQLATMVLALLVLLAGTSPSRGAASGRIAGSTSIALGVTGTPAQYLRLRHQHLPLSILASWEAWSEGRSPEHALAQASALHAVPLINWEPEDAPDLSSPSYGLPQIVAGRFDYYITSWAEAIKAYKAPVYLRFAHEMNGTWYPWSKYGPAEYVAAWRHLWTIFHRVGASNARFVWSPDGLIGDEPLKWQEGVTRWYPGAKYVDDVGMSTVIFESNVHYGVGYLTERLDFLRYAFHKPIVLPEVKVAKAARYTWLRALGRALEMHPWVRMLIWSETPSAAEAKGQPGTGEMDWSLAADVKARTLLASAVGHPIPTARVRSRP
jgi:Glycosyl hydrolase family 26